MTANPHALRSKNEKASYTHLSVLASSTPTSLQDLQTISNEISRGKRRTEEQDSKKMEHQQNIIPHSCIWEQDILNGALQGGLNNFRTKYLSVLYQLLRITVCWDFVIPYLLFHLPFPTPHHCQHFCLGNIRANREGTETRESHRRDCFGRAMQGCLTNPAHTRYY